MDDKDLLAIMMYAASTMEEKPKSTTSQLTASPALTSQQVATAIAIGTVTI